MNSELLAEFGSNVAILGSMLGLIGVSIKVGQWKGEHQGKIIHNEDRVKNVENQLLNMDKRLDRLDRELAGSLTSLQKDIE